jgi:hypothetical protein
MGVISSYKSLLSQLEDAGCCPAFGFIGKMPFGIAQLRPGGEGLFGPLAPIAVSEGNE